MLMGFPITTNKFDFVFLLKTCKKQLRKTPRTDTYFDQGAFLE